MIQTVTIEIPDYVVEDVVDERIEEGLWMIERMLRSQLLAPEIEVVKGDCVIVASPMTDTTSTPDPSLGDRLDAKIEEVKTVVNSAVDTLSAKIDQLQAAIDARQGQ